VNHGGIRIRGQPGQCPQPEPDVLQCHGLQLTTARDLLLVHLQSTLCCLTLPAELIQVARPVEVFHRGHPARVGSGPQVPPLRQPGQRLLHVVLDGWRHAVTAQRLGDVLGPQVNDEPLLADPEDSHHPAVQLVQRRVQVSKGARGRFVHDNSAVCRAPPTFRSEHARPARNRWTQSNWHYHGRYPERLAAAGQAPFSSLGGAGISWPAGWLGVAAPATTRTAWARPSVR